MINDFLAIMGVLFIFSGVWAQFGWPIALIILGIILTVSGIVGTLNASEQTIQQTNETE